MKSALSALASLAATAHALTLNTALEGAGTLHSLGSDLVLADGTLSLSQTASFGDVDLSRTENRIYLAKLCEVTGNFDDMAAHMKEISIMGNLFTSEEIEMLSTAYDNAIGSRLADWRSLRSLEDTLVEADELHLTREYRQRIETELHGLINEVLAIVADQYSTAVRVRDQVTYHQMTGDYNAHLFEISRGDEREEAINRAMAGFQAGLKLSEEELHPAKPARLRVALNFSVFLHDVMRTPSVAIDVARYAFDEVIEHLESCEESYYPESSSIAAELQANLKTWEGEYARA